MDFEFSDEGPLARGISALGYHRWSGVLNLALQGLGDYLSCRSAAWLWQWAARLECCWTNIVPISQSAGNSSGNVCTNRNTPGGATEKLPRAGNWSQCL